MTPQYFSIRESLRFGWQKTRAHSSIVFQAMLTLVGFQIVYSIISAAVEDTLLGIVVAVVFGIAGIVIGVGFTRIILKLAKGEHAAYKDIIPPFLMTWQYAVSGFFSGLLVFVGFLALIIPGVYLVLRYSMVRFAVLEGAGIRGSLKKSAELTHGVKWQLLAFFMVAIALNIVGFLLLFVGLLVTVPVTMLAYAHVYHKLSKHRS